MIKTLIFILNHPCVKENRINAFFRYFFWQLNRFFGINSKVFQFTSKTKLYAIRGIASSTGNYYCGLMEFNDMAFLLHSLDNNSLFIDVGANIGSYSVLASGEIGAKSICFEPVNNTHKMLLDNLKLNFIEDLVETYKIGIGEKEQMIRITNDRDSTNHIINQNDIGEEINIKPLDFLITKIKKPTLIKIDVEGYELNVLNGADKILNNKNVYGIIIEINGLSKRYNVEENLIHKKLVNYKFFPIKYHPLERMAVKVKSFNKLNTIYIRDLELINKKVKNSLKYKIGNFNFSI